MKRGNVGLSFSSIFVLLLRPLVWPRSPGFSFRASVDCSVLWLTSSIFYSPHLYVCLPLVHFLSLSVTDCHRNVAPPSDSLCEASPVSLIDSSFPLTVGSTVGDGPFINLHYHSFIYSVF